MKLHLFIIALLITLTAPVVNAGELDYLALLAEESEIKAIAVVANVQRMSRNADGSFMRVTFQRKYAVTPYTPQKFIGGCKEMENGWQKRAPGTVYFNPRKGQTVYVTITTNGGAITSYTPITQILDATLRREPHRVAYSKGRASVIPKKDI